MAEVGKIWGKEPTEIDKIYGQDAGTLTKVLGLDFSQYAKLPAGIIVPLRGAGAVPSGWSAFSGANAKYVIGAGTTYSPGNNGVGSGNVNISHLGGGAHTGNAPRYGWTAGKAGNLTQPIHLHTTMTFTAPRPYYHSHRLIKANSEQDSLPQDACLFKHASGGWTGLTRVVPSGGNRYFYPNTADGNGGKYTQTVTSSTNGAHDHGATEGTLPAGSDNNSNQALVQYGGHFHTFTASLSITLKYFALAAWYSASGSYNLDGENYIGMYESLTPPSGWSLCNGSNGTPDMRDRFVLVTYSDTPGGAAGSNWISCTSVTDTQGLHRHYERQCNSCDNRFRHHSDYLGDHTHTCNHSAAWLPPYYALAFIMYTG